MKFFICSALTLALAAPAAAQSTGGTSTDTSSSTHGSSKTHSGKTSKTHGSKKSTSDPTTQESTTESAPVASDVTGAAAASDTAATPATPATPADPATGTAATPATPASPSSQTSAAPAAGQSSDPATILKTEFPVYDKDSSGALSKEEFSTWLLALKNAAPQQTPMTDAQQTEWLGKAFTEADADKSSTITLAELTTYLTRGAKG